MLRRVVKCFFRIFVHIKLKKYMEMKKTYTKNGKKLHERKIFAGNKRLAYVEYEDCHLCTSHKLNSQGYLVANFEGCIKAISRGLYESIHGSIKVGYRAVRTCSNKDCINPDHIEVLSISKANSLAGSRKGVRR